MQSKEYVAEQNKKRQKETGRKLREQLLQKFGKECKCCGEKLKMFLTIDHINGDGNKHRKGKHQHTVWKEILRDGTDEEYRILCHNCNWAYGLLGYCPHNI